LEARAAFGRVIGDANPSGNFRHLLRRSGTFPGLCALFVLRPGPLDFWRTLIFSGLKWSEWRDSNPRPLVPQTSALTGLRYTPTALLIGAVAAARNVAVQPSASRRRRAGLRKDSLRFRDFVQRFAQRRELVLREPGTTLWRATIFRSPGGGRLGGDCGSYGRSDGR
jgi:hypothetical protein